MGATENNELEYQIIETAKQLFIEKGFVETSMSDIAAKVGINRPTFAAISLMLVSTKPFSYKKLFRCFNYLIFQLIVFCSSHGLIYFMLSTKSNRRLVIFTSLTLLSKSKDNIFI